MESIIFKFMANKFPLFWSAEIKYHFISQQERINLYILS